MLAHPRLSELQRLVLGRLQEPKLAAIEEHLLICERCRQAVGELDAFTPLLRCRAHGQPGAAYAHMTEDGPLTLEVRAETRGAGYTARFEGRQLEGIAHFGSVHECIAHVRRWFEELYPGHQCTDDCGPVSVRRADQRAET